MRLTLCLEQTLGHRAHTHNIEGAISGRRPEVVVVRVEYRRGPVPLPWAVRGSLDATRGLRASGRSDVTLFHTQSVALFAHYATRGGKYLVSLDATPRQMDAIGSWYGHRERNRFIEQAKDSAYRRVFRGASAVVAWSDWAKASLVEAYGLPEAKVSVISPGAGAEFFSIQRSRRRGLPKILFVGGDFERKGGQTLLAAFERLRGKAELLLVTSSSIVPTDGVTVINDATPGSEALVRAFVDADIFCLPTFADCGPIAVSEAMASGLPVVTTAVGASADTIVDGETGLLVPTGSEDALVEALARLVDDDTLSERLGRTGRLLARATLDAGHNAAQLLALMESVA